MGSTEVLAENARLRQEVQILEEANEAIWSIKQYASSQRRSIETCSDQKDPKSV